MPALPLRFIDCRSRPCLTALTDHYRSLSAAQSELITARDQRRVKERAYAEAKEACRNRGVRAGETFALREEELASGKLRELAARAEVTTDANALEELLRRIVNEEEGSPPAEWETLVFMNNLACGVALIASTRDLLGHQPPELDHFQKQAIGSFFREAHAKLMGITLVD